MGEPGLGGFRNFPGEKAGGGPTSESNGIRQAQLHQNWPPVPRSGAGAGVAAETPNSKTWVSGG